jgi:hypothetical protein
MLRDKVDGGTTYFGATYSTVELLSSIIVDVLVQEEHSRAHQCHVRLIMIACRQLQAGKAYHGQAHQPWMMMVSCRESLSK